MSQADQLTFQPLDDHPVWSIVCFFIERRYRRKGVLIQLIGGAIEGAVQHGADIVVAYPTRPPGGGLPPGSSYMGFPAVLEQQVSGGWPGSRRPNRSCATTSRTEQVHDDNPGDLAGHAAAAAIRPDAERLK